MQEAMLWNKERNGVRCFVCERRCFIAKGKQGYCLTRINKDNRLHVSNFGKLVNLSSESIEKVPMFHFYPNSTTLLINSLGWNFKCQLCKNWEYDSEKIKTVEYSPEDVVEIAEDNNCKTIVYSYSEPTMYFEFVFRIAKLAHRSNIQNVLLTNGYMTEDAVKKLSKYLDASNVNFKASGDEEYYKNFCDVSDTSIIFDNLKRMKKQRVFIEISNLILPQFGDNIEQCKKLADWINAELDSEIPFHILQFHPHKELLELPPTPVSILERFADDSKKSGLRYVYITGVNHKEESTYCYNCKEPLITRKGMQVKRINLERDRCPNCGLRINVRID